MYPLDEGKAVGTWKSEFLKNTIAAYGAVAGMNIFLSLLPIVGEIQISGGYSSFWAGLSTLINEFLPINTIVQLLIMVAGLFVVKELISTISSMIGGADAYSQGQSIRQSKKAIRENTKKAASKTFAFAGDAARAGRRVGAFFSSNRDRKFENEQRKGNGEKKIGRFEWMFNTDEKDKQGIHEKRMDQRSKDSRKTRIEEEAKRMYQKDHKGDDAPSWRKASEEDKKSYRRKAGQSEVKANLEYAKKHGLEYDRKMSASERNQIDEQRIAEEKSKKGFGKNTVKGRTVRGLAKGLGHIGTSLFDEEVEEAKKAFHEHYTDKNASQAKKASEEKKGKYGEKESAEDIKSILDKEKEGVVLKGVTSEVLSAMKTAFQGQVFKDAQKGKIDGFDFGAVGLNAKTATIEDVNALDNMLKTFMTQAERIGAADPALAKELATSMLDKLSTLDTGGNEELEQAVRTAMNALSEIKTTADISPDGVKILAEKITNAFKPLNDASTANAKAIQKYIEKATKDIVKAIEDEERRSSGKK